MSKLCSVIPLAALIAVVGVASPVHANSSKTLREYRDCVRGVIEEVQDCLEDNHKAVIDCLREARGLLRKGDLAGARAAVAACAEEIDLASAECIDIIVAHCEKCIAALEAKEMTKLAENLRRLCDRATKAIEMSSEQASKMIDRFLSLVPAPKQPV